MDVIGKNFLKGKESVDIDSVIDAQFITLYFGAHWAPPCRLFSPVLATFFNKVNENGKKVAVISRLV